MEENENKNILANVISGFREVVEAAETPFAKLAILLLPILAPLVPALLTGIRMQILLLNLVGDRLPKSVATWGSVIIAVVLELLGYVGAVMFVRSIFKLVKNKDVEFFIPVVLTGIAYLFYLADMYAINVQLNKDVPDATWVFGLLSFMTVPTGLLAATSINDRQENEEDFQIRQEKRKDKLEMARIKYGTSRSNSETNMEVPKDFRNSNETSKTTSGTMGRPSIHQERVFQFMEQQYLQTKQVPTFKEVMNNLNLPQSTASRLRDKWIENKRKGI